MIKKNIDQARELGVPIVEKLLEKINSNEKVRPFLREYPFGSDRVAIVISFYNKNNEFQQNDSISMVSFVKGKVCYNKYIAEEHRFEKLLVEPYEEARDLVLGKSG